MLAYLHQSGEVPGSIASVRLPPHPVDPRRAPRFEHRQTLVEWLSSRQELCKKECVLQGHRHTLGHVGSSRMSGVTDDDCPAPDPRPQ